MIRTDSIQEAIGNAVMKLGATLGSSDFLSLSRPDGFWRLTLGFPGSPSVVLENKNLVTLLERAVENMPERR